MSMSLISVYITNYNYGSYIEEAIESVLNQKKVDFELIIIDDGSIDNSKEIIEQYRNNKDVSIVYQKNKGLNITNNIALHLARGKYIIRLDADDYFAKDALFMLSNALESDKELGLVFPDYYTVDSNGKKIKHHQRHNFKKEVTLFDQAAHGACTMIRVSFLKALGGYNENYKCQDGYELWIKFTSKYKIININEPLFFYRQHGSNLTSNENKILSTRAQINADYVEKLDINNSAIAIIPVRNKQDLYYKLKVNNKSLINIKIEQALKSKSISKVVISSPDYEIKNEISTEFINNPRCIFLKRDESLSKLNTSLAGTVNQVIINLQNHRETNSSIVLLDLRFPLISSIKIDDAVNTMLLFKANSLISVRSDNNLYYKHDGTGMKPIMNHDQKHKLERDMLYKHLGGITVCRIQSFMKNQKVIHGKVGHMILDKSSAYNIENKDDLKIIEFINQIHHFV